MELKRRLSLVVAIMSVALGSGHLVQNVFVKSAKVTLAKAETGPVDIMLVAAGPNVATPLAWARKEAQAAISFAVAKTDPTPNLFNLPQDPVVFAEFAAGGTAKPNTAKECPVKLDLRAEPSAMIAVSIVAVCHANERVVLRHAGLAVTGKTSAIGSLTTSLPAFEANAVVSIRFADGEMVETKLAVPDAAFLRRFGVQWLDEDAFQLNAFENGAGYGEIGHISAADPNRPLAGKLQKGGFLSVLGDDGVEQPMLAEVYTYPADASATVQIVIEAAITKGTCARDILGETLADAGGDVTITDLVLTMPDCDAIGDILVLKNLDTDLKIASVN